MNFYILLTLTILTLNANHVSWQGDFEKAHKQALKENKKLMVLVLEKDCNSCKETIKTTFINQSYIDIINHEFISIIITKDQKSSYPIEMLYTYAYPTLFFLDNKELFVCKPLRGDVTPDKLKTHLELCR